MDRSNKTIILCDMSDEEIENIRSSFVESIGLSNNEYKAFALDYTDKVKNNIFFEEFKKINVVCVLSKSLRDATDIENKLM